MFFCARSLVAVSSRASFSASFDLRYAARRAIASVAAVASKYPGSAGLGCMRVGGAQASLMRSDFDHVCRAINRDANAKFAALNMGVTDDPGYFGVAAEAVPTIPRS